MKKSDIIKTEQLIEPAAVILLTVTLTIAIITVPAAVSFILPFGNFTYDATLALLQVGGAVLLVFIITLLIDRVMLSDEGSGNGTSDVADSSRES